MNVEAKKVVALCYELEVEGQIVDKTTADRPLEYIHGMGSLLEKFEKNVEGLEPGGKFRFTLTPAEGYGEVDPARIIDLPKEAFEVNGEIREDLLIPGATIPMMNSHGGIVPGKVVEVSEKFVKMDLNSPMAGKTLNFSGEVVSVREATEKELTEGLHGEFASHSCHCGGDHEGCGEGCGEGCHGEGHGNGNCCHGEGHGHGECDGHGKGEGHNCNGHGKGQGGCCRHKEEK